MPIFRYRDDKPGRGVPDNEPPKSGLWLFFYVLYRDFFDFVKLSLLFSLFCIPVITIPAAWTAMSRIAYNLAGDEHYFLWLDFWETFKKEFFHAMLLGWPLLAGVGLTLASCYFAVLQVGNNAFLYLPLAISSVCALGLILTGFYLFPMLAVIDLPLKGILKNAFLLALLYQPYNLIAMAVITGVWYLIIYLLPVSIIALPLFFFMLLCYIATFCAKGGISRYVLKEKAPPGPSRLRKGG